jgi:hypothetical protein
MVFFAIRELTRKLRLETLPILNPGKSNQISTRQYRKVAVDHSLTAMSNSGRTPLETQVPLRGEDRIYEVKDVAVIGGSSIVINRGSVIWEQARFPSNSRGAYPLDSVLDNFTSSHVTIRRVRVRKGARHVTLGLSLLDSLSSHFGHFSLGAIPKLRALTRNLEADRVEILVDSGLPGNFLDIISSYFPNNKVVSVGRGEVVSVGRLLIPQALKWLPDDIPGLAQNFGPERALRIPEFDFLFKCASPSEVRSQAPLCVRILRNGTGENNWRHMLNHDEVSSVLDRHGFEPLENLLHKPRELFSRLRSSTHIVTDDGSASFNLLLAGICGKRVTFLAHPGMGDYQQWFLPGYLSLFGNRVEVIKGNSFELNNKFSNWTLDAKLLSATIDN